MADAPHLLVAAFPDGAPLQDAVRDLEAAGLTELEAYTPYGLEGLQSGHPAPSRRIAVVALLAGLAMLVGFHLMQRWAAVSLYPVDVGGRPLASDPAFAPNSLEMGVLAAVLATVVALLVGCRLPRLYDPVFALPGFERATQDRFVLRLRVAPDQLDRARGILERASPITVAEVTP
jgi:hypothetical protein